MAIGTGAVAGMRRFGWIVLIVVFSVLAAAPAASAERFALLIGNQAYNDKVGPLRNPHNDIAVVGKALTEVGFKLLAPRKDATREDILFAVHELATQVRTAGRDALSFLYYAGHGVAVGGENVLIPTNAESTTDAMLRVRGVRLGEILDILKQEAPNAAHFVVLDACRNTLRGQRGTRGFVPVDDRRTGVVIAFSTAPGETATDEGVKSAPYAAALAEEIVKPGRNDLEVFNAVRVRVHRATGGQTPWTNDGLVSLDRVVFKATAPARPVPAAAPPPPVQMSEAERAWTLAKDTADIAVLEAFIARYKDTFYADLARSRANALKQLQVAAATPPPAAKPAPVVEPAVGLFSASRAPLPLKAAEERALKPKDRFKECGTCPEMVVVPAGSFLMGSPSNEIEREDFFTGLTGTERPQTRVTIKRPFAVGRFAVTFAEWEACVMDGGCDGHQPDDTGFGRGPRPVIKVTWHHAKSYTEWLSQTTRKRYRLLSEAEHEYVTRAGTTGPFWWGTEINTARANYNGLLRPYAGSPKGEFRQRTLPVNSFAANPWDLHNVHGNVREWTEDCWNDTHAGNPANGSARTTGVCRLRVTRGGSWDDEPVYLRSAMRNRGTADEQYTIIGFRVARDLE